MKRFAQIFLISLAFVFCQLQAQRRPRITLIFVIDQLSWDMLEKHRQHLRGGIHDLLHRGLVYHNAYQPHAMPSTVTGHTTLNTGTWSRDHGAINNAWFNQVGQRVEIDDAPVESAAVFAKEGLHNFGKSAHNIMVDGLTDQFMLQSKPYAKRHAYSVSYKSRAAIATANKLGKAIWFDEKTGWFTSSKAYFDKLPDWLIQFNKQQKMDAITSVQWVPAYPKSDFAYRMYKNHKLTGAEGMRPLFNTTIPIDRNAENPFDYFQKTPHANQLVFDLAKTIFDEHMSKNPNDQLLLWILPSSLDKAGHMFSLDSIEATDVLYHIDKQIFRLHKYIGKRIRKKDILMVLTSDHGLEPSPEYMQQAGYSNAHRILVNPLIAKLNEAAQQAVGISNLVTNIKAPNIYFNKLVFAGLKPDDQAKVYKALKKVLLAQPGIQQVWCADTLYHSPLPEQSFDFWFRQQLYPGRSGNLIVKTAPYNVITKWEKGCSHKSPYNYNTHIPLIIYQRSTFERKQIYDQVTSLQLANTLAYMMEVPRPSASKQKVLPHVEPVEDPCF